MQWFVGGGLRQRLSVNTREACGLAIRVPTWLCVVPMCACIYLPMGCIMCTVQVAHYLILTHLQAHGQFRDEDVARYLRWVVVGPRCSVV